MPGAAIEKCSGQNGGGVYVNGASVDIVNSTVNDNSAQTGGGVYTVAGDAKFNGRDGEIQIRDNKASECGGGVYTASKNLWMKRGQSIEKNNSGSYGGGLYVAGNTIMANGRVTFNTSQAPGGGVYIQKGTFKITSRVRIANNKSQKNSGGVGMSEEGLLFIVGAPHIYDNKSMDGKIAYDDDVYVGEKLVIKVVHPNESNPCIGIRGEPHVFVKGSFSKHEAKLFFCDDYKNFELVYHEKDTTLELVRKKK